MSGDPRLTRRSVLLGSVAAAVAACRPHRSARTSSPPAPSAVDDATLHEARASELALLAAYDATIPAGTDPGSFLVAARAVHAEHLRALGGSAGSPSALASPSASSAATARRLPSMETTSSARLRDAAITAEGASTAALLASIAASHTLLSRYRQVGGAG